MDLSSLLMSLQRMLRSRANSSSGAGKRSSYNDSSDLGVKVIATSVGCADWLACFSCEISPAPPGPPSLDHVFANAEVSRHIFRLSRAFYAYTAPYVRTASAQKSQKIQSSDSSSWAAARAMNNYCRRQMHRSNRRRATAFPPTTVVVLVLIHVLLVSPGGAFTFPSSRTPNHGRFRTTPASQSHHDGSFNHPVDARSLARIRGGCSAPVSSSALKSVAAGISMWAGLDAFSGMMMAFAPSSISKVYGLDTEKQGKFSLYLVKAIGCVLMGNAISLICATTLKMSAQKALGFGILVRLLFLVKSFLFNVYDEINAETKFLSINTVIMSWCTFSLLTGKGNPFVAAKTFSTAALLKASILFFNPIAGARKFFGIDISSKDMEKTKALCKSLGMNLLINAVFMLTLAFGIEARRAAGVSALVWSILLGETTFISKSTALMGSGNETGNNTAIAYFLFSALLSYVLLAG